MVIYHYIERIWRSYPHRSTGVTDVLVGVGDGVGAAGSWYALAGWWKSWIRVEGNGGTRHVLMN